MENWEKVCSMLNEGNKSVEMVRNTIKQDFDAYQVYPQKHIGKHLSMLGI